jgi:hypothetical protein
MFAECSLLSQLWAEDQQDQPMSWQPECAQLPPAAFRRLQSVSVFATFEQPVVIDCDKRLPNDDAVTDTLLPLKEHMSEDLSIPSTSASRPLLSCSYSSAELSDAVVTDPEERGISIQITGVISDPNKPGLNSVEVATSPLLGQDGQDVNEHSPSSFAETVRRPSRQSSPSTVKNHSREASPSRCDCGAGVAPPGEEIEHMSMFTASASLPLPSEAPVDTRDNDLPADRSSVTEPSAAAAAPEAAAQVDAPSRIVEQAEDDDMLQDMLAISAAVWPRSLHIDGNRPRSRSPLRPTPTEDSPDPQRQPWRKLNGEFALHNGDVMMLAPRAIADQLNGILQSDIQNNCPCEREAFLPILAPHCQDYVVAYAMPFTLNVANMLGDLSYPGFRYDVLPRRFMHSPTSTSGNAYHIVCDYIRKILDLHALEHSTEHARSVPVFILGYSSELIVRGTHYFRKGFPEVFPLYYHNSKGFIQGMEAHTISVFKDTLGCRNIGRGGDGPPLRKSVPPYWMYMAIAESSPTAPNIR